MTFSGAKMRGGVPNGSLRFRDFDKKHPKRRDLGGTSAGALINIKGHGFSELD